MSLNPIPSSLKSSVGSKSTNAHPGGGGGGEGGSFYHHDERSGTLCSSWVSRLHPRLLSLPPAAPPPPPPPARRKLPATADGDAPLDLNKHTISTDESRTPTSICNLKSSFIARRHLNLFERRSAGLPPPPSLLSPPRIVYNDGGDPSVSGFGPFQFRSRNAPLPRGQGSLRVRDDGSERVLGRGDYGEGGGCFPLFRRMAGLGEGLDGESGIRGSRVGRQLESVHAEEQLDRGNVFFHTRRAPHVHSQVKLSPFFQFRPLLNSGCSIDRNKGIIGHPMDDGSTKILENRSQMRPASNGMRSLLPISHFPSKEVVDDFPSWRQYERHLSVDPWHASASVQHVARSRGTYYHDGADEAAPIRTSCDHLVLHQNMATNHLERTPVRMNEPKEPFSFWNMGRFKRRNAGTSVSPTIALTSNLSMKRSAKFDDSLPPKFRKLGNED